MDALLSILVPLSPIILNVICIVIGKGKIISLIVSLCATLFSLFMLMINNGYGIGFGNPWIGVDWEFTAIYVVFLAAVLTTHWFVPSTGIVRKISIAFVVLAVICAVLLVGMQILNTIEK